MVEINEIFDIQYGNQFDISKMEILEDDKSGINFISRNSNNNGLVAKVSSYKGIKPFEGGLITVTMGGTYLLASFIQPAPFYTAQNIKVLKPKLELTIQEKLYYCAIIEHNRFRYHSHSREANSTFDFLLVPSLEELPSWVNTQKIESTLTRKKKKEIKGVAIDIKEWKPFRYDDIFIIKNGFYNKKPDITINGNIPFIGATDSRNGITSYHTLEEIEKASKTGDLNNVPIEEKIFQGNCITVSNNGSVGYAFYQPIPFTCSHDVNPLYLRNHKLNRYIALFLCTLIEKEQYRWAYGRKWRPKRMPHSIIKLPVTSEGKPDWIYMENYIKSLPFSANL